MWTLASVALLAHFCVSIVVFSVIWCSWKGSVPLCIGVYQRWHLISVSLTVCRVYGQQLPVAVYAHAITRTLRCSAFVLACLLCEARLSIIFPSLPFPGATFVSVFFFFLSPLSLGLQCDGCLVGCGWAGLGARSRVGQVIGCSTLLGVGFAVSAPRLLGTKPPFAT